MVRSFGLFVTVLLSVLLSACSGTTTVSSNPTPALIETGLSTGLVASPTAGNTNTPQATQPAISMSTGVALRAQNTPLPLSTSTPVAATPRPQSKKRFMGYYVPYDTTSWMTLQAQADLIDYVAVQWVTIDACGNLESKDDRTLIEFAQSKGIKVLPSLLTSSESLNHRLLTDNDVTTRAIQQIVDYVVAEGYDGFDLDFEGVAPADRSALTSFVARLSQAIHQKGKLFTMALPAKTSDTTTGWGGAFEYAALAPHIDLTTIMSYAYTLATTPPGSTAPYNWVDKVAAFASSQIPKEKVLLGLAFYGYDWNTTTGEKARAVRYSQAAALASKYGAKITNDATSRSATFNYQARLGDVIPADSKLPPLNHVISSRRPPACIVPTPTALPRPTTVPGPTVIPKPSPTVPSVSQHVVWLEDAESVKARLSIADKYGVRGVGAWRLGQEDPGTWSVISNWRRAY